MNTDQKTIYFNKPAFFGNENRYIQDALKKQKLSGDGHYTHRCHQWIEQNTQTPKALLTTSCTHALEMAAMLLDIKAGDEVIMPSYTFVSTANAFVLRGAKIVFVDIRPDTMNIDETKIEAAITQKTKAIVAVHYAGIACEMDSIMRLAKKYGLYVVEDAAQAITAKYKNKTLGTIGDLGTYSFHDTKNITCGEGGVLLINKTRFIKKAEIIREKGTNRSEFFKGEVNKYEWKDIGSSYLPSELNAAVLWAQLENIDAIQGKRLHIWNLYYRQLQQMQDKIELPTIPKECQHNAHLFYIKCKNADERNSLIAFLRQYNIYAVFHYVPLHSSYAGNRFGIFAQTDKFTTKESERLLRLPLHGNLKDEDIFYIISKIKEFYYG